MPIVCSFFAHTSFWGACSLIMVSNSNSNMVETSSSCDSPTPTEILILELRSCLDTLQQDMYRNGDELDTLSDEENKDRYKWLADTECSKKPSKQMLDDLTLSEITHTCQKITDSDIVHILREMHHQAHLGVTPSQLLSHVKYLLSESLISQQSLSTDLQTESGRNTPTSGRHLSFSGVLAGLKAFRRNRPTPTNHEYNVEPRQTAV